LGEETAAGEAEDLDRFSAATLVFVSVFETLRIFFTASVNRANSGEFGGRFMPNIVLPIEFTGEISLNRLKL
jgi:hypothetical protein